MGASAKTGILLAAATFVSLAGCMGDDLNDLDQTRSDLVSLTHKITIPAYYQPDDTASWSFIGSPEQIIINGPGSRPPALSDPKAAAWSSLISQYSSQERLVMGYVDFFYGRDTGAVQADIDLWHSWGVEGIFFDETNRSLSESQDTTELPNAEYFANYVRSLSAHWGPRGTLLPGQVIFNFSFLADYFNPWVYCITHDTNNVSIDQTRFISEEQYADDYADPNGPVIANYNQNQWVNAYWPQVFINAVHRRPTGPAISTGDVLNMATIAANFNADSFYVTDYLDPNAPPGQDGNTWGGTPSSDVYNGDSQARGIQYNFPGPDGSTPSPPPGGCPALQKGWW